MAGIQMVFRPTGPDEVATGASVDGEMWLMDRVLGNTCDAYAESAWKGKVLERVASWSSTTQTV